MSNYIDDEGYATEEFFKKIREFQILEKEYVKEHTIKDLISLIKEAYWMPDMLTAIVRENDTVYLRLSTGGWSGNEDIITELEKTAFWMMRWYKEIRGGHYWFELKEEDYDKQELQMES